MLCVSVVMSDDLRISQKNPRHPNDQLLLIIGIIYFLYVAFTFLRKLLASLMPAPGRLQPVPCPSWRDLFDTIAWAKKRDSGSGPG
jgi:hypothetical protein